MKRRLNQRITVIQQTTGQDGFGQPLSTWAPVASLWASIDIQNSQLVYSTAEFISKTTYRITIRWSASIVLNVGDRIQTMDQAKQISHVYEIQAITNTSTANRELLILAYELDGDA